MGENSLIVENTELRNRVAELEAERAYVLTLIEGCENVLAATGQCLRR